MCDNWRETLLWSDPHGMCSYLCEHVLEVLQPLIVTNIFKILLFLFLYFRKACGWLLINSTLLALNVCLHMAILKREDKHVVWFVAGWFCHSSWACERYLCSFWLLAFKPCAVIQFSSAHATCAARFASLSFHLLQCHINDLAWCVSLVVCLRLDAGGTCPYSMFTMLTLQWSVQETLL